MFLSKDGMVLDSHCLPHFSISLHTFSTSPECFLQLLYFVYSWIELLVIFRQYEVELSMSIFDYLSVRVYASVMCYLYAHLLVGFFTGEHDFSFRLYHARSSIRSLSSSQTHIFFFFFLFETSSSQTPLHSNTFACCCCRPSLCQ